MSSPTDLLSLFGKLYSKYFAHKKSTPLAYQKQRQLPDALCAVLERVDNNGLSYLGVEALSDLARAMLNVENGQVPGAIIETGCALGGSSIVLAAAKSPERKFMCYDVFAMIPPPSEKDGEDVHKRYAEITSGKSEGLKGQTYYGYQKNLIKVVENNFNQAGFPLAENNITLVQGLYEDTLVLDEPVALAHIDCDWYESVKLCLERIAPHVSSGGVMIIDDYYYYDGCRQAVDEFLAEHPRQYTPLQKSRLHLRKI